MIEIGGYIELDKQNGAIYHENAVALNCGRAALEYLIRAKKIKKLYIPYFCCDSVAQPCRRCEIAYEYYRIDPSFRPVFNIKLKEDEWLYLVNYYGQLDNKELQSYKERYGNVIVDNAQAYFQRALDGVDTIYTCRKFFGVSDGAFLYTDKLLGDLEQDESFERIHYVLGRFERGASEFYQESAKNNALFQSEPLKKMSKLTDNLLRAIDYDLVKKIRNENFRYLHDKLGSHNRLKLTMPEGAFMYPLYLDGGSEIRRELQSKKIYIPTLWPDVFKVCNETDIEYDMAKNILPLPVDQRYGQAEMEYLVEEVKKCIG